MSVEQWRRVEIAPDYEVSDLGRVRSWRGSSKGRILHGTPKPEGYLNVSLRVGAGRKTVMVHRLVAAAFCGPRPEGADVRHLDGDQLNNSAKNLRYGTRSQNEHDKVRHGRHHMARRTHCNHGHEFSVENTVIRMSARGSACRTCRICQRTWGARSKARKRAARFEAAA